MDCLKIEGLDKLLSKLNKLERCEAVQEGLKAGASIVESAAKEKCPVDTGDLKRSITSRIDDDKAIIGTNLEYGPYVEFGTGLYAKNGNGRKTPWSYTDPKTGEKIWTAGQHPQPFLHPALTENAERIQKAMAQEVKKKIMEVFE